MEEGSRRTLTLVLSEMAAGDVLGFKVGPSSTTIDERPTTDAVTKDAVATPHSAILLLILIELAISAGPDTEPLTLNVCSTSSSASSATILRRLKAYVDSRTRAKRPNRGLRTSATV